MNVPHPPTLPTRRIRWPIDVGDDPEALVSREWLVTTASADTRPAPCRAS
jgi:hypothetical protein